MPLSQRPSRHRSITGAPPVGVVVALIAFVLGGCGGAGDDSVSLSPEAETGRKLANSLACASCHGAGGVGGVGPKWVGLYGSQVTLEDGTTVTADDDYLVESIVDPDAKRVDGYSIPMPGRSLSDDEVAALVAYIRELTPAADDPGSQAP